MFALPIIARSRAPLWDDPRAQQDMSTRQAVMPRFSVAASYFACPCPLPGPVVSSAVLHAAETLSLLDSRQARTSPWPCSLPAQSFGMSSLQAVATGPPCAEVTPVREKLASIAAAIAVMRLMSSLLFHVDPVDPVTYGAVMVGLAGTAFLASYLPSRRARSVDPVIALRAE